MYELIVIGKTGNGDAVFSKVEKIVKDAKATDVKVSKMGKRELAYPIEKQTEADYFLFNFEAEGSAIGDISESLRLEQDDILRYLILKTKHAFSEINTSLGVEDKKLGAKIEKVKVEIKAKPKVKTAKKEEAKPKKADKKKTSK